MVVEPGVWCPDVPVSHLPHLQAEIHVVERHLEVILVEPPGLFKNLAAHQHARGGHRGQRLRELEPVEIPRMFSREIFVRMAGDSPEADDHPPVLDPPVGIIQLGTHAADVRPDGVCDHLAEPVAADDLNIVIDESDDRPHGPGDAGIVNRGEVERPVAGENFHTGILRLDLLVEVPNAILDASVVKDQDLEVAVGGIVQDAVGSRLDEFETVACGDEQADERRRGRKRPADAVGVGDGALFHTDSFGTVLIEMVVQRLEPGFRGIVLAVRSQGRGSGKNAPVVEDMRDVDDPVARHVGHAPQQQILILAALDAHPEAPDLFQQIPPEDAEVAYVVLRVEKVGVPVALEMGFDPKALRGELVLVAVKDLRFGVFGGSQRHVGQRVFRQDIIVVEQGHVGAPGDRDRGVRGAGNMAGGLAINDPDALVTAPIPLQDLADMRQG